MQEQVNGTYVIRQHNGDDSPQDNCMLCYKCSLLKYFLLLVDRSLSIFIR